MFHARRQVKIAFLLPLGLCGCHREIAQYGPVEWGIIAAVMLFVLLVFVFDNWLEEEGWRITPAPHIGLNEPTTIQAKVAAEANKQHEHAGSLK